LDPGGWWRPTAMGVSGGVLVAAEAGQEGVQRDSGVSRDPGGLLRGTERRPHWRSIPGVPFPRGHGCEPFSDARRPLGRQTKGPLPDMSVIRADGVIDCP